LRQSTGKHPQKASYPGHVWTWDFIHDWTLKGGSCRILRVVDEYTRQAHCLHVARHIGSKSVQLLMEQKIAEHGAPAFIRSVNGPEFIGRSLGDWLNEQNIKTLYIDPGSPWQNGYVESFHDKFRRECLGREIFSTLSECRVVVNDWKRKYNQVRPHRSLGMQTPLEFAWNQSNRAKILPALRHDMITVTSHSTWARKSTAGALSIVLTGGLTRLQVT
jgi:putative transposase